MFTEQILDHHSVQPEAGANQICFSLSNHTSLCPRTALEEPQWQKEKNYEPLLLSEPLTEKAY